ncbi:MAG TPA: hypothetical protein VLN73_08060 [Alphaproteobacteria bacterium]|nr:hypothetical protein [Alphaproteobacteria bacterium]
MLEALYLVIGLMILMAMIPIIAILSLALAIVKRFVMRWSDAVERYRFRVRLGGNVAYFIALLNAIAVLYYFIVAGLPVGDQFMPWLTASTARLPEGWYLGTAVLFLVGGFTLKVTRLPHAAAILMAVFIAQISLELAPAVYALAEDPGLFSRFFEEIERLNEGYKKVGGFPKTVMGTVLAGLAYGLALQATYYVLATAAFVIALQGAIRLRAISKVKETKARMREELDNIDPFRP